MTTAQERPAQGRAPRRPEQGAHPPRWRQFPASAPLPAKSGALPSFLLAAAPVAGVAAAEGSAVWLTLPLLFVAGCIGVVLAELAAHHSRPGARAAVVAVSLAGSALVAGRTSTWALGLSLAAVLVAGRRPEGADRMTDALELAAGPSVLAGLLYWRTDLSLLALLLQVAAIVAAVAVASSAFDPSRLQSTIGRVVRTLLGAFSTALFFVLWVVFVLVPWCFARPLGWDPTWWRRPPSSRFVPLKRGVADQRWQWRGNVEALGKGFRRRLHGLAVAVVPVLALAALAAWVLLPGGGLGDTGFEAAAMEDSPWWHEARAAQLATFDEADVSGFLGPVLADVDTRWTNVSGGLRRSWSPDEPESTVWLLGGSAAFGLGQRDEHTIASELARVLTSLGQPTRVVNMAVHGDVHWMELNRVRGAFAMGAEVPDAVVFYGGFNDLNTVNYVNAQEALSGLPYVGSLDTADVRRGSVWEDLGRRISQHFEETGLEPVEQSEHLASEELVEYAIRQYEDAVGQTRELMGELGVATLHIYQPSRATRSPGLDSEGSDGEDYLDMERAFRMALPEGVLDLSAAMDDLTEPVYWDAVHTNELGARRVAEEIARLLEPVLRAGHSAPAGVDD